VVAERPRRSSWGVGRRGEVPPRLRSVGSVSLWLPGRTGGLARGICGGIEIYGGMGALSSRLEGPGCRGRRWQGQLDRGLGKPKTMHACQFRAADGDQQD
jgi:hypothetical protein